MDRSDELLEEPLYLHGAFVRRWDQLARLPRPDAAVPDRPVRRGWPRLRAAVPAPRMPQTLRWAREPADD
ncbi:hypothetical protein [Blastococcus sp. SYSU D01042]